MKGKRKLRRKPFKKSKVVRGANKVYFPEDYKGVNNNG